MKELDDCKMCRHHEGIKKNLTSTSFWVCSICGTYFNFDGTVKKLGEIYLKWYKSR